MQTLSGQVISTKMTQTAKVEVRRTFQHPKYQKSVSVTKKYLVHDTIGVQEGDTVRFTPCKPVSKNKRWTITEVVGQQFEKKSTKATAKTTETKTSKTKTTKKRATKKTTKK